MVLQDTSDQPAGDGGARITPELRAEADRLRRLSDPQLTAPIFDDSSDDKSPDRQRTFFDRLREVLFR